MACEYCNPSALGVLKEALPTIILIAGIVFILYCFILYIKMRLKKQNGV